MDVGSVTADIDIIEVNPGPDYLGAGMAPLSRIYFVMSCAFFVCALLWGSVLYSNRQSQRLYRVHYLMLALILFKAITLVFRAIDYHYIMIEGTQEEGWAVVYYIAHLAKGIMLFVVIMLIGAGFGFVKHALSKNERLVFLIVIPLQVCVCPPPSPSPPSGPLSVTAAPDLKQKSCTRRDAALRLSTSTACRPLNPRVGWPQSAALLRHRMDRD